MANVPARGLPDGVEDLVRLAATGHRPAFARLVRLHHDDLVRVCLLVTGDIALARIAVAETWAIAWREIGRLDRPARFGPWLATIGADLARPLRPGSVLETAGEPLATDADLSHGVGYGAADQALAGALAELSSDDRALLALPVIGGLDEHELAAALRLPPAEARPRRERLLETLVAVPGHDDEATTQAVERRLRLLADVPVRPVDADAVARAAHAAKAVERRQLASVAVSAVIATLLFATIYALTAEYADHPGLPGTTPTPRPPAVQLLGGPPIVAAAPAPASSTARDGIPGIR